MLDAHTVALWVPISEPGGIPKYYRTGAGAYSLRRVFERIGGGTRLDKRWVLYWKEQRLWDLPSMATLEGAMEQAEDWLQEHGLVKPGQPIK